MDQVDQASLDLVEPAFIALGPDGSGEFAVIAIHGWMDCRTTEYQGRTVVEFSWLGDEEGELANGRGRFTLLDDSSLDGVLFVQGGDELTFRATRLPSSPDPQD
ncbi:hypothetical protein ACQPXM_13090 [Kribbella sp. CA-253562]|uniref:hypothetical protein n=1 Tax=Kribbella sp. CA-253562 TaxID=3239942 RepID=UPI003D8F906E